MDKVFCFLMLLVPVLVAVVLLLVAGYILFSDFREDDIPRVGFGDDPEINFIRRLFKVY